jgi:ABC-type sugar transport system substrate-binding protein
MRRLFLQTSAAVAALCLALPLAAQTAAKIKIVVMPKLVGIDYYNAVKSGIDEAVKELPDVEVVWTGPTQAQVEKQIEMIEAIIPTKPAVIAVAANDAAAIAPVMKKAKAAGIKVMSWDGDSNFRDFFVNLVDYDEFGAGLVEAMVKEIGPKGDIAIITTSFTAPNQTLWIAAIKKTIAAKYPGLKIIDTRAAGESTEKSFKIAQDYVKSKPNLKGIIALGVPNVPGAIDAVKQAGKSGKVAVIGNATPNMMRGYLKDGTIKSTLLWSAPDHGYLTVYAARQLATEGVAVGKPFKAGRMGTFTPKADKVNLSVALPVMVFTKDNVDQFKF